MDNYSKLVGVQDFDHDKARQLAALHEEIETLKRRQRFLEQIANKHRQLEEYLWRTKDGKYMLVHDMEDSHLKNAVAYMLDNRGEVPFVLTQEYVKRFGDTLPKSKDSGAGNLLSAPMKRGGNVFEEDEF